MLLRPLLGAILVALASCSSEHEPETLAKVGSIEILLGSKRLDEATDRVLIDGLQARVQDEAHDRISRLELVVFKHGEPVETSTAFRQDIDTVLARAETGDVSNPTEALVIDCARDEYVSWQVQAANGEGADAEQHSGTLHWPASPVR